MARELSKVTEVTERIACSKVDKTTEVHKAAHALLHKERIHKTYEGAKKAAIRVKDKGENIGINVKMSKKQQTNIVKHQKMPWFMVSKNDLTIANDVTTRTLRDRSKIKEPSWWKTST